MDSMHGIVPLGILKLGRSIYAHIRITVLSFQFLYVALKRKYGCLSLS